ncbi:hypothetical protein DL768_010956 [Monosporascus sp. mg162]|nr:hypothetical protein DL768_010956 [Monosporascus sp. mg162]
MIHYGAGVNVWEVPEETLKKYLKASQSKYAPLASIARLAYQVPVANGTNRTVIYPIVLILATAEQAVAMVAGSAPVASAAAIRIMWRKLPGPAHNRTVSQRIWPGREARGRSLKRDSRGVPDPFPITDPTLMGTGSAEVLYSNTTARHSDGDNSDWEMTNKTTSNVGKAPSHGASTATEA